MKTEYRLLLSDEIRELRKLGLWPPGSENDTPVMVRTIEPEPKPYDYEPIIDRSEIRAFIKAYGYSPYRDSKSMRVFHLFQEDQEPEPEPEPEISIVARERARAEEKRTREFISRDACGVKAARAVSETCSVPIEVFATAVAMDARTNVDLLALGKPAGDIFEAGHWMHEAEMDSFNSAGVLDNIFKRFWIME